MIQFGRVHRAWDVVGVHVEVADLDLNTFPSDCVHRRVLCLIFWPTVGLTSPRETSTFISGFFRGTHFLPAQSLGQLRFIKQTNRLLRLRWVSCGLYPRTEIPGSCENSGLLSDVASLQVMNESHQPLHF